MAIRLQASIILAAAIGVGAGGALAQDAIRIGASLPLTGNFSVSGEKHKQGYELCAELINEKGGIGGAKLELAISDNRSDTETAISQTERMINLDSVDLLFGTFSSKLTFPVSAIAAQNGYVYPIPAGGALPIYARGLDNIFYFQHNAAEYTGGTITRLITDLIAEGERPKTAALVHADDFFGNGIAAGLLGGKVQSPGGEEVADLAPGFLADIGIEVVYQDKWPEEGFSDWINLANSIKRSEAELIIGLTASAEEAVQLTRALKTVKAAPKLVYLSQGTQTEFHEGVGDAGTGIIVHTAWHPKAGWVGKLAGQPFGNADFVQTFAKRFGFEPDEDSAIPFALCQGIAQAIEGAGGADNAKVKAWLKARTAEAPVETILGPFHWDQVGLPVDKAFLVTQWQGEELSFVYPTGQFEGVAELIYPKPEW
jgi:branched-chain amino acid transport system substrate-binding protein